MKLPEGDVNGGFDGGSEAFNRLPDVDPLVCVLFWAGRCDVVSHPDLQGESDEHGLP